MLKLLSGLALTLVCGSFLGCGGGTSKGVVDRREKASLAFDQGKEAFENKDFTTARSQFDEAINGGVLYIDLLSRAHILRAVSAAHGGDFAAAHEDLDKMEQGAPEMDQVLAARSFVFAKEGKTNEARNAWNQARRINPRVRQFE